jgi:hypothetical protein
MKFILNNNPLKTNTMSKVKIKSDNSEEEVQDVPLLAMEKAIDAYVNEVRVSEERQAIFMVKGEQSTITAFAANPLGMVTLLVIAGEKNKDFKRAITLSAEFLNRNEKGNTSELGMLSFLLKAFSKDDGND